MTWNYRVIKETVHGETTYWVHEVYYNEAGEIESWTEAPVGANGETLAELREDLETMLHDTVLHDVLNMEELRKRFPDEGRDDEV